MLDILGYIGHYGDARHSGPPADLNFTNKNSCQCQENSQSHLGMTLACHAYSELLLAGYRPLRVFR